MTPDIMNQPEKKWAFDLPTEEATPLKGEHEMEKNDAYLKMETELNEKITAITLDIRKKYPELISMMNELPITIPNQDQPDVSYNALREYYDSLCQLVERYELDSPKSQL